MTGQIFLLMVSLGSLLIIAAPKTAKYFATLFLIVLTIVVTSNLAIQSLIYGNDWSEMIYFLPGGTELAIDKLASYFILIINFTVFTGIIYAKGYLKSYENKKQGHQFSIHYFSYLWLYFSMVLVTMVYDGLAFLIVWEFMALSSFLLVIFDSEKEGILKVGLSYLIQMHIGLLFLLVGFVLVGQFTGTASFDSLGDAFASENLLNAFGSHGNFWLFLIFFVGFGIKAGFIPLHTWLPHAHPAAPSHVSAVMSSVIIKMGVYGILRVILSLQSDMLYVGIFILFISLASGLYGVMMAIVQHDLKRLLAYHSIENIGIIGIGIGLGVIGMATGNSLLAVLGFSGGLLHVLNHSLFKSLLFYTAGSVYTATGTRDINNLGGLIKNMPKTAFFFLLGALAICGLPPFNGFISEFLIYDGLFRSLNGSNLNMSIVYLTAVVGLALIGGLAIFCFTKAFGMVFLGTARKTEITQAQEVNAVMIAPKALAGLLIVAIGLLPFVFIPFVQKVVNMYIQVSGTNALYSVGVLNQISIVGFIFIGITGLLLVLRYWQQQRALVQYGPTWGCGYTGADPAIHQYTATSFADNYKSLAKPIVGSYTEYTQLAEEEIFPAQREFKTHVVDKLEVGLINRVSNAVIQIMERFAVLQTGHLQHYLIYPLVFILVIFLLTYFQLI
ncbi:MAG: hydrogenase-4 component B [Cyclobacteriaceae bacterium]|jgi:hydrogenase-4 component B